MDENDRDRLLAELIEKPQERDRILQDASLGELDQRELTDLIETADAVWASAQHPPALEDDPVAAMLGLVPDRECTLNSAALSRARKRAGLNVSAVAERLRQRGWAFTKSDVFRWETSGAADVPPAAVQAVAEVLHVSADDLVASTSTARTSDVLAVVRRNPLFGQLVDRWARVQRVSPAVALSALEGRALATVHRGERPDADQLLRSLDALVSSVEQGRQE